ncbi:hypothetical protein Y699_03390 [Aspergillus fumigatus Z5]|nr:hypothetical protein Y699_03390 [Aspergillus fumigatus Z5]
MDWVLTASSSSNIHHVTDIKVGYNVPNTDILEYYTAYGPEMCKALARLGWSTGKWTIQNTDSLTLYAFAKHCKLASDTTLDNNLGWSLPQGVCAAADDEDGDEAASAVMTTMTPWPVETDYPSDYLSSWSLWAGLTPITTTTAAAATITISGL